MKYVAGLVFNKELSHVALIKKNKPSQQAGLFNAIGGKIEKNETPLQAIQREWNEETKNLPVDNWTWFLNLKGETWEVYWFLSVTDDLHSISSNTEEEVQIHHILSPLMPRPNTLPCVTHLPIAIVAALQFIQKSLFLSITESPS